MSKAISSISRFYVFACQLLLLPCALLALQAYQDLLPNGNNVVCGGQLIQGVGHISSFGAGPNNQFGLDFRAAGHQWTQSLCTKDSDKDGFTNGQELGDPNCVWTIGDVPSVAVATAPGIGACFPASTPVPVTTQEPSTPTTAKPTTPKPTTAKPTTPKPTTAKPTTPKPTTAKPTTPKPTTAKPTTPKPTTAKPTTQKPTTAKPAF